MYRNVQPLLWLRLLVLRSVDDRFVDVAMVHSRLVRYGEGLLEGEKKMAELVSSDERAGVVMTSDPSWYRKPGNQ